MSFPKNPYILHLYLSVMAGVLKGDTVILKDQKEGSQLYNRGNYGYPLSGGGIELDLIEATYLVECNRLTVTHNGKECPFEYLFSYSSSNYDEFDIKYIVYRDIRQRGFVVKNESGDFDMAVFPRGMTLSNSRPQYYLKAVSERTAFDISTFRENVKETNNKGKQLLYGVVDEEGDLTYYIMSTKDPVGFIDSEPEGKALGIVVRDRVFVFDRKDSELLRSSAFYGKMISDVLQLSLIESCHLMEKGILKVVTADGDCVTLDELKASGREFQDEFDLRLRAFSDLRRRGLVVKTGFKYGTHFRVYEKSPDDCHARYLVHSVSGTNRTMWPEISRAVRLSGGVKKEILFCRVTDRTEYMEFKWFRP